MPANKTELDIHAVLQEAEERVKELIAVYGLDFVLRICATAAIDREASHRAVQTFTASAN